ncbi:MAG: hypothetical protein IPK46_06165 [Saprospiraceae bacterium]|nr:hypothetical protein [Saprospiraceae bacterium]
MTDEQKYTFDAYRYQILPTTKDIQSRIDDPELTYGKLIEKKNDLFKELLHKNIAFKGRDSELVHSAEEIDSNYIALHFGIPKKDFIEKPDFTKEEIRRYPDLKIFIDNNKNEQLLLIQRNYKAVAKTDSVSRLLEKSINRYLENYQLRIYIQPIYSEALFWELVTKYNHLITRLTFEFIRPNLANISGGLADDLRSFQEDSNAHKGKLYLEAPNNGSLEIDPNSLQIKGLVDYSSKGGGDITLKVKGMRKTIKTSEGTKTMEISEAVIKNPNKDTLDSLFNSF